MATLLPVEDLVHVDERKWPDRLHWQFSGQRLGEDAHGVWLYAPPATVVRRGDDPPQVLPHGFVMCVPAVEWWLVEFFWDHPRHPVYVNIGTPGKWDGDRVTHIDLDLDVLWTVDGAVEVVDEDEFAAHRAEYGYPAELVEGAVASSQRAVTMLRNREEPFGLASRYWIERAGHG